MKSDNQPILWDHGLTVEAPFRLYHYNSSPSTAAARPDMHYSVHFGILLEGSFESVYPEFTKINSPGDVWFTAPWEPHSARRLGDATDIVLFSILPEKVGDIGLISNIDWLSPFLVPPNQRPSIGDNADLRRKVLSLGRDLRDFSASLGKNFDRPERAWLKLHESLLTLIEETGFRQLAADLNITNLMDRISPALKLARLAGCEPPSLEEAAAACGLGKSRFSTLFKKALGVSFAKFADRVRIGTAAADVKRGRASIKEIANAYGYHDESHFHRAFKRHFNTTPGEYRKSGEFV